MNRTCLYFLHKKLNAKLVPFAGWEMPLHYGSQLEEHQKVRQTAGMFDVSHMGVVDIQGPDTEKFLRFLVANNVDRIMPGKALYTCMLNEHGGIIDDLIVYKINPDFFRLVVNAGTKEKDLAWINKQASAFNVSVCEHPELAIIAVQGPLAFEKLAKIFDEKTFDKISALKPFQFLRVGLTSLSAGSRTVPARDDGEGDEFFIARTGYTGEDGVEMIVPEDIAKEIWESLIAAGVAPCGLGARDTLRLEAGLNLYGQDMDEQITPLESNLTWTVALEPHDRDFIGRSELVKQQNNLTRQLVGLVLEEKGVLRPHQKIICGEKPIGEITSGSFSPTLGLSVALARLPTNIDNTASLFVEIRDKYLPVRRVKLPFVRKGKKIFE